jgi:hypothetical protein
MIVGVAVTGALLFPAQALARTVNQAAHSGAVTAAFSFDVSGQKYRPVYTHLRLQISRSGQVVYDGPMTSRYCQPSGKVPPFNRPPYGCQPGGGMEAPSVSVVGLESSNEPNVVLSIFLGGNPCCSIEQVFSYDVGTGS